MESEKESEVEIDEVEKEYLIELHEDAMKKYKNASDAWESIFTQYVSDVKFAHGDQWDSSSLRNRKQNNRSALVYNKLPANIKFIVNNARSCTPEIKVHPVADGATKNTAKIYDGIIKSIQYKSNAKSAYVKALEGAVTGGIGAFRVLIEDNDYDEKPEVSIKVIKDPTSLLLDPNAENCNFSDAEYAFLIKWMPLDEFEELYPDKTTSPVNENNKDWYKSDSIQVCEYWVRKEGKICYYLITGDEVLEVNEKYKGKYIPFCLVTGTEIYIDGTREFKGIVRDVVDQQRMLNYSKSETADFITRSAKQQWLVEADQIADYQEIWDNQNIESYNYLPYKGTSSGGKPQKIEPVVPPTGFMATSQEADNDIRATIGIRDPLQDIPSSQSGKAIQLQIAQGNLGTFEYLDNLNAAIKYAGQIIVDLIPHVYNYQHIREIMGLDENVTPTPIMQTYEDNGELVMHDLSKGYYSLTLSIGPSYDSQRSEAADKLLELVDKYPNMMQMAGDLIVQNLDFKGADELSDRLRATIPPEVLAQTNPSNGNSAQTIQMMGSQMQQMNMQLQQLSQMNQELQAQLQQAGQLISDKNQERQHDIYKLQLQLQSQERQKEIDNQYKLQQIQMEKELSTQSTKDIKLQELQHKLIFDNKQSENDVKVYGKEKLIDLTLTPPEPNIM